MRHSHKMAASNDAGARIHKSFVRGCAGAGGGQQVAFNGGTASTTKCRNTAPPAPSTAYQPSVVRPLCTAHWRTTPASTSRSIRTAESAVYAEFYRCNG